MPGAESCDFGTPAKTDARHQGISNLEIRFSLGFRNSGMLDDSEQRSTKKKGPPVEVDNLKTWRKDLSAWVISKIVGRNVPFEHVAKEDSEPKANCKIQGGNRA